MACSPAPEPRPPTSSAPSVVMSSNAASPVAQSPFDVHEWGVIDVSRGGAIEVGAGPGAPSTDEPRPVKKPVLYFHLDPGAAPVDIAVTARIPGGSMAEVWPMTRVGNDDVAWPNVRLHVCPSPPPEFKEHTRIWTAGYPTRDGFNEVRELVRYETTDSACLTAGDTTGRLLFYRGATRGTRLPIEIVRDHQGAVAMRASAVGTGTVLFVQAGGRGTALPYPPVDHPVALPEASAALATSLDGQAQARLLEKAILERGLTPFEATAFMNAWKVPFFGEKRADSGRGSPTSATCAPRIEGPPASIVYLMPEATVNDVATLTITPAPRSLKRVMVVRIELPD